MVSKTLVTHHTILYLQAWFENHMRKDQAAAK